MSAILDQLGLNITFFYQLAIIAVVFIVLSPLYFRPFLKLFKARHERTVADRESAEKLIADADAKFEEYKRRLAQERAEARAEFETLLNEAKKEEAALLSTARAEAKKITQEAAESVSRQHEDLRRKLEADVENFAKIISEKLLSRPVDP